MSHAPLDVGTESPLRRATAYIAAQALAIDVGDRMPNIVDLRTALGVGVGTVQTALRQLQVSGALTLDTQQRRGTFLMSRDVSALWRATELGAVTLVMPLPSAWEFYGLVAGFHAAFDQLNVPLSLVHLHGSHARLAAIEGRPAAAVLSRFAAQQLTADSERFDIATHFPDGTYYARDSVVVLSRDERASLGSDARVGIDESSIDHASLTRAEFPGREYIDVNYARLPAALRTGVIDVAVWHRTALWLSLDDRLLHTSALTGREALTIAQETSSAAIVVDREDEVTRGLLRELSISDILATQAEYVEASADPS